MLKVGSRVRAKEGLYRKHLPEPVLIVNHVMPEIFQCFVMTPDGLTRHHGAWDMDVFEELPDAGQCFDIEPGEVALCDYSHPPDIHCRRVKTIGEVSDGYHTFDELQSVAISECRKDVNYACLYQALAETVAAAQLTHILGKMEEIRNARLTSEHASPFERQCFDLPPDAKPGRAKQSDGQANVSTTTDPAETSNPGNSVATVLAEHVKALQTPARDAGKR